MVEANNMKSKTNEGPLVRSKSNEGPLLVQSKSSEVSLAQRRLSSQSTTSEVSLAQRRLSSHSTTSEVSVAQRRLSSQSTTSVKARKRASLGQLHRPSVAKTNNKIDLKKTNSYVNSLCKAPSTKVAADKGGDEEVSEKPIVVATTRSEGDEVLEKHTEADATKDVTGEFLENESDRFQLVNALEAILAQPSKNINPPTDQPNVKDDQSKSDVIKAKNDPSKFKEEIKSNAHLLRSVNDKIKTLSLQDKSNSTSRASPSEAKIDIAPKSKSIKALKAQQTLNTKKPSTRPKQLEPVLNPPIKVKTTIPSTEVLTVSKISGPRNSTGSVIRSSKCSIKPNRASLSPKKSSSVNRPTKLSSLPKSSSSKPIRTSTPKNFGSAKSTRSPSVSQGEDSSGSTPLLKNSVSIGKSGVQTVPKKGTMENLNSKIVTSNKTVSMPNLCNIQQTDDIKNRSNSTKKHNVGEPKVMEIIEQKFGLKLEGVTARNKLVIAKIVEQVEGIEHSLKLTNQAKEDELQKHRDDLQRQRMANEQLKKNNELLENCQHKIKETMADREEEMMREIVAKNSQIEELKIFSMKNTDFLNGKLLLRDEDTKELNEHVDKLKIILIEKDNLLQEAFDQQTVYQEKIKQYENSEKLKDELMDDMMANHRNEIESLGLKISDKDRIAKDLKLKVSKLIAEFTKEFKEKDEEIKMKNEQLKFKTREASNAIVQNKFLEDDLVKIKKVLSDKLKDLELGKALNHEQAAVIENLNQQLDNFTNERNQQFIVIDNLTKEISDLKKEVIKIERVDLASNSHNSVNDPLSPVQEELSMSDVITNTSDMIKSDNPEDSAQTNMKFEKDSKPCVYEPNLEEILSDSCDDSEMKVNSFECSDGTLKIHNNIDSEQNLNVHKEEKKQTFEVSENKIAEVPADERLNQTDMETEIDVKMIENARCVNQFKSQAGFDMPNEEKSEIEQTFEPSKDISVQFQADGRFNQIHRTDMEPKIDINVLEISGEAEQRFDTLMVENNEIKQTFEPSKDRIAEVQTYESLHQKNQTDVQVKLDPNMTQTSRDVEQLESNSQAEIDMKRMDKNVEMNPSIETNKNTVVEVKTSESLNKIDAVHDMKLKEGNLEINQSVELSNGAIVKIQMDESLNETNVVTKVDFKTIQSKSDFQQIGFNSQTGFDIKLKESSKMFDPCKDTPADENVNKTVGDVESLESDTQAGFDMKLKEKNRKIIMQTFEPIQDIIIEVSKHMNYEHAPKVEEFSNVNEHDGFNEGFETVTCMTKNGQSSTFLRSCDPSSYSLADLDVSLGILENKRSLKKKRKELISPQDDFVEHVLNFESIVEGRTGVVKCLIRDFEELATDSNED